MSSTELEVPVEAALEAPPPRASAGAARQGEWLSPGVAWYAVCMVALVTVFGQLDNGVMSLLVPAIKHDTRMSDTELSLLMGAAFSLVYLCSGVPLARLSDAGRRTFILPAALAVWSLGTVFCGLAQNFWQFALARGIIGGGISVKGPTSVSIIPDLVPKAKLARAFAIYNLAVSGGIYLALIVGGLILGVLARHGPLHLPFLGVAHPWQMVFFLMGIPGLVIALTFMLTVPEPARHGRKSARSVSIGELAHFLVKGPANAFFIPLVLATAIYGLYTSGGLSWRPAFYERTYHLQPSQFGPISGMLGLITTPVGLAIGAFLSERMARRWDDAHMRLAVIVHCLMLPLSVLSPLMPTWQLAMGFQAAAGLVMMISAPSVLAAMQIVTPNQMRAQVNAVYMFTISVVGPILGPTFVALLNDHLFTAADGIRYSLLTAAAIATPIAAVLQWRAMKRYGRLHRQVLDAEAAR